MYISQIVTALVFNCTILSYLEMLLTCNKYSLNYMLETYLHLYDVLYSSVLILIYYLD